MRTRLVLILLLMVGGILAASLLLSNRSLNPSQLAQVRTSCLECHSVELRYSSTNSIHNIHAGLSCNQCHVENNLQTAARIHSVLEWLGIGLGAVMLALILINFIIARKRIK